MRLPLVLLALALLPVPSGLAQVPLEDPQFAVFANDPGRAFIPGSVEPVNVVVTYGPGQRGRPAPAPSPERPEDTQPTRITFAAKTLPSWVDGVTFVPPEVFVKLNVENASRAVSAVVVAMLNVSPEAPALIREDFVVTATAEPNGNMRGKTTESPALKLRATTIGILNVTAESPVIVPGGRWVTIDFAVRNDGNAKLLAKINVTVRPENSQVEFRDTLEIERDQTILVPVRMRTPWTNAEFGTLELEATPIVEGEEGTPARATIDVRGESAVAAPSVWLALLIAGLVGRARRR